ncbi:unnamed protein product, partial [Mesorhabditis belari]|uniref:RING-type domain-containing protein n=1 Tax=Mesorhabditis belari TaxID=2138241 RepID=A0AAF3EDV4_9BILA
MKVFESLNCFLCKKPFARIANQPRSPRILNCGLAVCHECFEMEKAKSLATNFVAHLVGSYLFGNVRKHHCNYTCCYSNPNFAYYLIDILSQEESLVLAPTKDGYVLEKPFQIPECPVCHDEYSITVEAKKSIILACNHAICTECALNLRELNPNEVNGENKYIITCPLCTKGTDTKVDKAKDPFQDFLAELPKMVNQLESMRGAPTCAECDKKYIVDEMLRCVDCKTEICAMCVFRNHRSHKACPLLGEKAGEMFETLKSDSRDAINTYKNLFPELHKELLDDISKFETSLLLKEEALKDASTFIDLEDKHKSFATLKTHFENTAEKYLPCLRKFNTEIKEMIETLDKVVCCV